MAVRVLSRSHARTPLVATTLPASLLLVTLLAPVLDLLANVQPGLELAGASLAGASAAALLLVLAWGRYPRTNWLAAAWLAAVASVALRLAGADQAAALSLLSILALGVGGAFASRVHEMDALLELQPSVARR
jgi:hypothetical protein